MCARRKLRRAALPKTQGRNKHQKAAQRPGERKLSRAQVEELPELSCSGDADERLVAAQFLCPWHARAHSGGVGCVAPHDGGRGSARPAYGLAHDQGRRLASDSEALSVPERKLAQESGPRIIQFSQRIIGEALREHDQREWNRQRRAARPASTLRGKCDFCGARDVFVERDLDTLIPTADLPRPALICAACA